MNSYPKFAQIGNIKYKINTNYKVAIECERVAHKDITDEERALAIIYLLFGDRGLRDSHNWEKLLGIGLKYLNCGQDEPNKQNKEESNMDFQQDREYIRASFFYDYKIRLDKRMYMHWWEFYNLLCGLSDKCILNRVRFVRDFDVSQIKDRKEKEKWIRQKELVALKQEIVKTPEQQKLDKLWEEQIKGGDKHG